MVTRMNLKHDDNDKINKQIKFLSRKMMKEVAGENQPSKAW